ncbi:MAG: UV DNA damage repair endonuclease UvsE [Candidatus Thermoplasmatota archaeon]
MKVGYPCINRSIGCTANSTFRLANYSEENLIKKVENNINCLEKILNFNIENNLLFFRISSDIIPFASHPICKFNWRKHFRKRFGEIGKLIKENEIRISMHPDQFVLINSIKEEIVKKSIEELRWHCNLLDLMKLDFSAKVQIHVGGLYGDKNSAIERFIENFRKMPNLIKRRIVIENDEKFYSLKDCLYISEILDIPVVFDSFHHECLNNKETVVEAIRRAESTWKEKDGLLMVDYSSQEPNSKKGKHANHIDIAHFTEFIKSTKNFDFDIMLEIKDKEKSALEAIKILHRIEKI